MDRINCDCWQDIWRPHLFVNLMPKMCVIPLLCAIPNLRPISQGPTHNTSTVAKTTRQEIVVASTDEEEGSTKAERHAYFISNLTRRPKARTEMTILYIWPIVVFTWFELLSFVVSIYLRVIEIISLQWKATGCEHTYCSSWGCGSYIIHQAKILKKISRRPPLNFSWPHADSPENELISAAAIRLGWEFSEQSDVNFSG